MQRTLTFTGDKAATRFEFCRSALLSGGDGKGDRGRETIRREARLLDAFDTISVEDENAVFSAGTPNTRVLRTDVSDSDLLTITIRQDDYELLVRYVDTVAWTPRAAREAVDVQDWLGAAPRLDA